MKSVIIYLKSNDKQAESLGAEISSFLNKNKIKTTTLTVGQDCSKKDEIDLVIVLGGDGSFLASARCINKAVGKQKKLPPFLGVNLGSLGFITECRAEEALDVLNKVIKDKFDVENRSMLEADTSKDFKSPADVSALNDIVLSRKSIARVVDFDVFIDEEFVSNIKADGVIVSTPTGSTAYSLAAGGPILHPELNALAITPISPHTLTNRPIVVDDKSVIKLVVNTEPDDVMLTLDGQYEMPFGKSKIFYIRKASRSLPIIRPYGRTYFSILRDKLAYGKRGHE